MKKKPLKKPLVYKKGYKVVCHNLTSMIVNKAQAEVQYKKGEAVKPQKHCGALAVFTNKKEALTWAKRLGALLFHCEYTPSKKRTMWFSDIYGKQSFPLRKAPAFTALADTMTLLEELVYM